MGFQSEVNKVWLGILKKQKLLKTGLYIKIVSLFFYISPESDTGTYWEVFQNNLSYFYTLT